MRDRDGKGAAPAGGLLRGVGVSDHRCSICIEHITLIKTTDPESREREVTKAIVVAAAVAAVDVFVVVSVASM